MEPLPASSPFMTVDQPVPQGARAYRGRIRRTGPLFALVPPAILGVLSLLLLRDNTATWRGVSGFLFAVLSAPFLLVVGVPLTSGTAAYLLAIAASAAMWALIGAIAARRATTRPVASWRDFWREYAWFAAPVWLGVAIALLAIDLLLGRPFV